MAYLKPLTQENYHTEMLTMLFSGKQAKTLPIDPWYRILAPTTGASGVGRDIILHFQLNHIRMAFMAAVHNMSPLQFENHTLTFYHDLSKATMDWQCSLRPLTLALARCRINGVRLTAYSYLGTLAH
ncbi:Hypothetical predicted protein [Pelobates cultripes]|uniref:Uncharacterized protein n=1 Tax=Pelobates cultripes TaxID=61616 RepID=A0AAD1RWI8_PELCU|nr:Hypothetical predicted protein [Pelobates cultripes]